MTASIKKYLKNLRNIFIRLNPITFNLDTLSKVYGSDKHYNNYTKHYGKHFAAVRTKKLNILEIGVGGGKNPKKGGSSLKMWKKYFRKSMIYGIDIYNKKKIQEKRIVTFQGDQNDQSFLEKVADSIGRIDIIIDDGSHINSHVRKTFETLFPRLSKGGIYAIEDLATSYWPAYGGNWKDLNDKYTSVSLLKELIDGLNYMVIPNRNEKKFDSTIIELHFYPKIAFIMKGTNKYQISKIDRLMLEKY